MYKHRENNPKIFLIIWGKLTAKKMSSGSKCAGCISPCHTYTNQIRSTGPISWRDVKGVKLEMSPLGKFLHPKGDPWLAQSLYNGFRLTPLPGSGIGVVAMEP